MLAVNLHLSSLPFITLYFYFYLFIIYLFIYLFIFFLTLLQAGARFSKVLKSFRARKAITQIYVYRALLFKQFYSQSMSRVTA